MRNNKGFTLIEIIAVLVILVITAAVGIPNVDAFIENAEQNARMTTARTVFYAAQNALTKKYSQDSKFGDGYTSLISTYAIPSPADVAHLPAGEVAKATGTDPALIHFSLARGEGANNVLYQLLAPYLTDPEILSNAILIEFNRQTGKMLGAFYSDDKSVTEFDYATTANSADDASLRANRVGYFGVNSTGEPIEPPEPEGLKVVLRDYGLKSGSVVYDFGLSDNTLLDTHYVEAASGVSNYVSGINGSDCYGLLTVECTLPQGGDDGLYHLRLHAGDNNGQGQGNVHIYFSGGDRTPAMGGNEEGALYSLADLKKGAATGGARTLSYAIEHPIERDIGKNKDAYTRNTVAYAYQKGINTVVVFVLDCAYENLGITKNYPEFFKENGNTALNSSLDATLTVEGSGATPAVWPETQGDPTVQTLFAGTKGTKQDPQYEIGTVRHLNNLRYEKSTSGNTYWQSAPVPVLDYNASGTGAAQVSFVPLCSGDAFAGTYISAKESVTGLTSTEINLGTGEGYQKSATTCAILDLKVAESGNAGLFSKVASGAEIDGVCLRYDDRFNGCLKEDGASSIAGGASVGGIAGVNNGTIKNCTVAGRVQSSNGDAGGIAGENAGTIQFCYVGADVLGGSSAGGIAGRVTGNGKVRYCEVGTASRANSAGVRDQVGTPYYGAWIPRSSYDYNPTGRKYATANNTFKITLGASGGGAGGIVGVMIADDGLIEGCVNAAKVNGGPVENESQKDELHGTGAAGGIVGYLGSERDLFPDVTDGMVSRCYNAGAVYGPNETGGVAGFLYFRGTVQYCYNTGFVNRIVGEGSDDDNGTYVYAPGEARNISETYLNTTGGIVGRGWGRGLSGSSKIAVDHCYSMQYAGDEYGGAFGNMYECDISDCAFLGNVLNEKSEYFTYYLAWTNVFIPLKTSARKSTEGLSRVSTYDLQNGTPSGLFDDHTLMPGREYGVGAFRYTLPYLSMTGNDCNLGSGFHRTPWNRVQESNGLIHLSDNGSNVKMEVFLRDEIKKATVELRLSNEGNTYYRSLVLDVTDDKAGTFTAAVMDGTTDTGATLTFTRTAITEATTGYEREASLGFSYVYVCTGITWDNWAALPSGEAAKMLTVLGILEGAGDAEGTYYDQDRADRQVNLDPANFTAALRVGTLATGNGADTIKCAYVEVDMQQVGSFIVNVQCAFDAANPSTFTDVKQIAVNMTDLMNAQGSIWDSMHKGPYLASLNGRAAEEEFPFYYDQSTDKYYVVLYALDIASGSYFEIAYPNETNVSTGRPVRVLMTTGRDKTGALANGTITAGQ